MKLFHVSEESDINVFHPRLPTRTDLDPNISLVWAVNERCLPNFLTPRDCPRVTYHVNSSTTLSDRRKFFCSIEMKHAVVIEHGWFEKMKNTVLYVYEFNSDDFFLQDEIAGYYVSRKSQYPIACQKIDDIFARLISLSVELKVTGNLWHMADEVKTSTLNWSLCRMKNALPRNTESIDVC